MSPLERESSWGGLSCLGASRILDLSLKSKQVRPLHSLCRDINGDVGSMAQGFQTLAVPFALIKMVLIFFWGCTPRPARQLPAAPTGTTYPYLRVQEVSCYEGPSFLKTTKCFQDFAGSGRRAPRAS